MQEMQEAEEEEKRQAQIEGSNIINLELCCIYFWKRAEQGYPTLSLQSHSGTFYLKTTFLCLDLQAFSTTVPNGYIQIQSNLPYRSPQINGHLYPTNITI